MDVQNILKQLEVNEGTFPREAVVQAIEQREAMTPELLRILEYAHQDIEHLIDKGYMAHIYAMYLLAQFREPRAYPLIVQFFSIPGEITLDVTGDLVTGTLCRILASVSGGDISLMTSLVENEEANEYVRSAALRGMLTLVACGEKAREEIIAYYQSLFRGRIARDFSFVWNGLVSSSDELYPEELYEDIKQAYADELVESFFIRLEDVEETLESGKEHMLDELRNNKRYSLITDTISEMEWWACFQPQDRPSHTALPDIQVPTALPDIQVPTALPDIQTLTKKSQRQPKDKRKRKLAKASRRKNRR